MNELEQKFLAHSAAGQTWKRHKYIAIENGRYIYPEDLAKRSGRKATQYGSDDYYKQTGKSGTTVANRKSIPATKSNSTTTSKNTTTSKPVTATTKSASSSVNKTNQAAAAIADKKYSEDEVNKKIKDAINAYDADRKKKEEEEKKTSTKKSSSSKKKSSSSSKKTSTKASKEASDLGLTDDDLKALTSNIDTNATSRDEVINSLALKVIRGDFGNGQDRKNKLGSYYSVIQQRVNELMRTMGKGKKSTAKKKTTTKKSTTSNTKKTVKYGDDSYYKQTGKSGTTVNNRKTIKHSDEEFLMHFGTKKRSGRYAYGSGDRPYQHDPAAHKKYKDSSYKDRRRMSDEELEARIARARKEGELRRLEADNRPTSKGKKFVQDVLTDIGKNALRTAGTGAALYLLGQTFVADEFNNKDFGRAISTGRVTFDNKGENNNSSNNNSNNNSNNSKPKPSSNGSGGNGIFYNANLVYNQELERKKKTRR